MGYRFDDVKDTVRKVGKTVGDFWYRHRRDVFLVGEVFLLEYGALNLLSDVSGLTREFRKLDVEKGRRLGYAKGFNDGQRSAAQLIAMSNGDLHYKPVDADPSGM